MSRAERRPQEGQRVVLIDDDGEQHEAVVSELLSEQFIAHYEVLREWDGVMVPTQLGRFRFYRDHGSTWKTVGRE